MPSMHAEYPLLTLKVLLQNRMQWIHINLRWHAASFVRPSIAGLTNEPVPARDDVQQWSDHLGFFNTKVLLPLCLAGSNNTYNAAA